MERILKARDNETGEIVKFKWFDDADPTDQDLAEVFTEHRKQVATQAIPPPQEQPGLLEQIGRGAVKQLPLAGMMFGGAGGLALGGPPGAVLGGTTMAGAGQAARRLIETQMGWGEEPKPLMEEYYDIGLEMKRGAEAEMGGGIAGHLLGAAFKGAKAVAPNVRELFREGFPVTRGTVIEKAAQKIPPGSWWFKRWGKKLNEMVQGANTQFQRERLTLPPTTTPKPSIEETQAAWKAWLDDVGGKNAVIDAPNLRTWFGEYGPRMGQIRQANKSLGEALDRINHQLSKTGNAKLGDVNDAFKNLWATWRKLGKREFAGAKAAIGKFKESAVNDFRIIENTTGTPIYSRYLEADELQRMGHSIDRAKFVERLFNRAMRYNDETGEYIFQPVQFKSVVEQNYQKILQRFGKGSEVPDLLMEYANKMEGAARDLAAYTKASRRGLFEELGVGALTKGPILGAGGAVGGIPGVAVPGGFDLWMAHSLAHPRGYLKRFLFRETPGAFLKTMGKEATRMGLMIKPPILGPRRQFEEEYGFPP